MPSSIHPEPAGDETASGVKITRVETLQPGGFTFVRVHTDAGVTGLGEMHPASSTSGGRHIPPAVLRFHEEYLIGKDPTHIERHWQHMFRRSLFRGGSDAMAAISALDMALWDVTGKLFGLPVYRLLGGPVREKVKLFATPGAYPDCAPERWAESAAGLVGQGFSVLRFYPLGSRETFADMGFRTIARTVESYVAAVRGAVGEDVDIAIDVICLLSPAEAIEVGRAIAPYGLMFFEDPIEPDNIEAMAHVAARLPMPVATGERLCTIHAFRDLLNRNAAAFLRPDLALAGGITNVRKIAALAEASYVQLIPHNPLTWINAAASLHLAAATHNVTLLEHHYQGNVMTSPFDDVFIGMPALETGHLIVPDRPGLGIEINDEALKHYPPATGQRPAVIRQDGSLRDY
jgi:galactonate dehydratase